MADADEMNDVTSSPLGKRKRGRQKTTCMWCGEVDCMHCRCTGFDGCDHGGGEQCIQDRYSRRLVCNPCARCSAKASDEPEKKLPSVLEQRRQQAMINHAAAVLMPLASVIPKAPADHNSVSYSDDNGSAGESDEKSADVTADGRHARKKLRPGPKRAPCQWCSERECNHCRCAGFEGCKHVAGELCSGSRYKFRLICNACGRAKNSYAKTSASEGSESRTGESASTGARDDEGDTEPEVSKPRQKHGDSVAANVSGAEGSATFMGGMFPMMPYGQPYPGWPASMNEIAPHSNAWLGSAGYGYAVASALANVRGFSMSRTAVESPASAGGSSSDGHSSFIYPMPPSIPSSVVGLAATPAVSDGTRPGVYIRACRLCTVLIDTSAAVDGYHAELLCNRHEAACAARIVHAQALSEILRRHPPPGPKLGPEKM